MSYLEGSKMTTAERLEYLRGQLRAECISMSELHELQGLADVPEHDEPTHRGHFSLWGSWYCDTCDSPYCDLA